VFEVHNPVGAIRLCPKGYELPLQYFFYTVSSIGSSGCQICVAKSVKTTPFR
jgi:hypothetical protein